VTARERWTCPVCGVAQRTSNLPGHVGSARCRARYATLPRCERADAVLQAAVQWHESVFAAATAVRS
jgi:hypothetical protein